MRSLLLCLLLAAPALAQTKGMLDSLDDGFNPSKDRRGAAPAKPAERPAEPLATPAPDTKPLEERIRRAEAVRYDDIRPVADLDQARSRINRLRSRARRLQHRADERTAGVVRDLQSGANALRGKWQVLNDALHDGEERTQMEWVKLARQVYEPLAGPPPPPSDAASDIEELFDPILDEPVEKILAEKVEPPDLSDLKKAILGRDKPATMHPTTWLAVTECFERDLEDLGVAVATARKQLKERRRREFEPVAEALTRAQRTFRELEKRDTTLPEHARRQLAWRIHQARLAEMRLAREDQLALAEERARKGSDRKPLIEMHPLAPEESLRQLTRLMATSGAATAPGPYAFGDMKLGEQEGLYPEGDETKLDDPRIHYGKMSAANIERFHAKVKELKARRERVERTVERRDKRTMRTLDAELARKDRKAKRFYNEAARDRRRAALDEKWQELKSTRAERVAAARAALDERIDEVTKRLQTEYDRRDEWSGKKEEKETDD